MTALWLSALIIAGVSAPDSAGNGSASVQMVAVQASNSGAQPKAIGPGLEGIRSVLEGQPFDTFRRLKSQTSTARYGHESTAALTDIYTIALTPNPADDGRIRLDVRVIKVPKDRGEKPVNVLSCTLSLAPKTPVVLRGVPLEKGELLVVLSLAG